MYEEYFGLSGAPFKLNPDPRFFFGSRSHNKAMAYLHYGLKQAEGFIVITGPIGAGKSMLIGHLLDQLNRSNVVAAHLLTSNVKPDDLLGHILSAFRIEPEGEGRAGQLAAFEDFLFDQLNRGRRALLVMDEAQNLPHETLEELRMLSNMDYDGTPLFQVFLVGQPEFRNVIDAPEMEQLRQRVIASYHLENLSADETKEYVLHRLSVAGWLEDPDFSLDAFSAIYSATKGLPRQINTLCNRLMLYCFLEKHREVTREIVEIVLTELREEKLAPDGVRPGAMPAVKSVDGQAQTPSDGVAAVSLDAARQRAPDDAREEANAKDETPNGEASNEGASATPKPEPPSSAPPVSSSSVFDRLRASRRPRQEAEEADPPRHEATLSEVASAIAAVTNETEKPALDGVEQSAAGDHETTSISSIAQMARDLRLAQNNAPQWRKSVAGSLNDTRDELKQAHASVSRLRKKMADIDKRRINNRAEIVDSLSRAETLLREIRDSWQ